MIQRILALVAGACAFCLVAILNCGGYRYGTSDQAFYIPAVLQHLDPALFPHDRILLHAQDRFMLFDEVTAATLRWSGVSITSLMFAAYLVGLLLLFAAAVSLGRVFYRSWWSIAVLVAMLTLRHRITQTGVNTLEAYTHPRMLAFAIGLLALVAFLRGRSLRAFGLVMVAGVLHPTTAVGFGIWIVAGLAVAEPRWRRALAVVGVAGAFAAILTVSIGPLRGQLARMDDEWMSVLASKDYLFPSDWGAAFWVANLGYVGVVLALYRLRAKRSQIVPREKGLVAGAMVLACLFFASVPFALAHIALVIQLQPSRIFWMLDALTTLYLVWLATETVWGSARRRTVAAIIIAIAMARGSYVMWVEHDDAPLIGLGLPQNEWTNAMGWLARTPPQTQILADPAHSANYGSSVRVAAHRNVYLEEDKDAAVAMYSREMAARVLQRKNDAANFAQLAPEELRALALRYDQDYLVTDRLLPLPAVYGNGRFHIYALK